MPFKSEAQRRKFHAMASRGEISEDVVDEWEEATGDKKLPPKKTKKGLTPDSNTGKMEAKPGNTQEGVMSKSASDILSAFTEKMKKALTGRVASNLARSARAEKAVEKQGPTMRTSHTSQFEHLLQPAELVTPQEGMAKSEVYEPCSRCGLMSKSNAPCRRCTAVAEVSEAPPYWKRK